MARSTTPVVGITTYAEPAAWGAWNVPTALVPMTYVESVEEAGGRALLVPPSELALEETLDVLDGIIFSGGNDLDPATYGARSHPETNGTRPERDHAELALMRAALERDMPVLAICRGFEIMNVARGGDLVQHLPDVVGDERHKHTPGVFADHDVRVSAESRLGGILGDRAPVKSHHHQGVGRVGEAKRRPGRPTHDSSPATRRSIRRSGTSQMRATPTYRPQASHWCTKASGMASA